MIYTNYFKPGLNRCSGLFLLFMCLCTLNTYARTFELPVELPVQKTITGTVRSAEDNTALPGVSVVEKGTSNGTVTDFDGNYSLNVADGAILEFSFVGFKTQEMSVSSQSEIDIDMQTDVASLDEVVVVGYGTQKKRDLTGAISRVSSEDFSPGANRSAADLLKGTASGVAVTQTSSAPGSGQTVRIRGAGSINSSNGVLYVVDGLPGVDPNSLSPGDIESVEILKDASAASIYGTRAANGVVLITTKKGQSGTAQISYNTYTGIQDVPNIVEVLNAQDYARLVNQRLEFDNRPAEFTDEDIAGFGAGTNWQQEIFRKAVVQNHQISVSGGDERSKYYVGINYFDQDGVVINSGTKKYNLRTNVQSNPLDRLKLSLGINYTEETIRSILSAGADGGLLSAAQRADPTIPAGLDPETGRYYNIGSSTSDNPLALANGISNKNVIRRFYTSLTTDYEVVDNLTATLRLGAESNNSRQDAYNSRITMGGLGQGGVASISAGESTHWLVESLLKYENTFNDVHDFSILGGATWERFDSRGLGANSRGFISDVLGTNALESGDGDNGDNVSSDRSANQLNGFLGRMTYAYDGKYLLTASFRLDGSSRFSDENKYAFFPSASLGWRLGEEAFLNSVDWVDELKLRVGYGELGNQGINNFETIQTLVAGGNSVFNDQIAIGVVPARLPNSDLRWETTSELNVGLDYGFVNNRITGAIDYFYRVTKDQLFFKPLPAVVGFSSVRTNIGEVLNTGVDFSLSTKNLTGAFKWNTDITFSYLKNEVTSLPDFTQEIIGGYAGNNVGAFWIVQEAAALRSFYGYVIDGLFQEGDDIANSPTPAPNFQPGMPRFVDQNGDGTINAEDRVIIGSPFPDYTYGMRNTFSYKNFTLSTFINGVEGVDRYQSDIAETLYPQNNFSNPLATYYYNRWTPENTNTNIPSGQNFTLYGGAQAVNTLTVVDASYVRLKNVTLSYNFPLKDSFLSSLNIFVAGDNLATWTDFLGYDPEANIQGGSLEAKTYNAYPLARVYRLGLDIKF